MTYYHLPTDTERSPRRLETKLSDGATLGPPPDGWTDELAALRGFVRVIDTPRPPDTDTHTHTRSVVRKGDTPTVVWTARPWTADETRQRAEAAAYIPPETRIEALERVLVTKAVVTDAELTAERTRPPADPPKIDTPIRSR